MTKNNKLNVLLLCITFFFSTLALAYEDISRDGKQALSIENDGSIILWNAKTDKIIATYRGEASFIRTVKFSNSGKQALLTDKYGDIAVWKISNLNKRTTSNKTISRGNNTIYDKVRSKNTKTGYIAYVKQYPNSPHRDKAISEIYKITQDQDNIKGYRWFAKTYSNSKHTREAVAEIYNSIDKQNNLQSYKWFANKYAKYPQANKAIDRAYDLMKKTAGVKDYLAFLKKYRNYPKKSNVVNDLYQEILGKNNTFALFWFLERYGDDISSAKKGTVLSSIYEQSYALAKKNNTIQAYDDFIIAYPYSIKTQEVLKLSAELEKDKYTGFFLSSSGSKRKSSRSLLRKIKDLTKEMYDADDRTGYYLVINRINNLLEKSLSAQSSVLDYFDSIGFERFSQKIDDVKDKAQETTQNIDSRRGNITKIVRNQIAWAQYYYQEKIKSRKVSIKFKKDRKNWKTELK